MSIDKYNKFKQGFTLIEVLISMAIVAVGLLGLAAMQLTGLQNNQRSFFRTQATLLAYDMSDRMRANPDAFNPDPLIIPSSFGAYNNQPGNPITVVSLAECIANSCTSSQMASFDLTQWNAALSRPPLNPPLPQGLPLGIGVVCIDRTPNDGSVIVGVVNDGCDNQGNTYAIKVWWDDAKTGNADQQFVMSFEP